MSRSMIWTLAMTLASAAAVAATSNTQVSPPASDVAAPAQMPPPGVMSSDSASKFVRLDANSDGALSQSEVGAGSGIRPSFKTMDANNDGKISPLEFSASLEVRKDKDRATN